MGETSYLDWNGSAPLCAEARAAMIAAMDVVGNPSSVHSGGRRGKALIDDAREHVAALVDCQPSEVVFTSGATESANWVLRDPQWSSLFVPVIEHDAVLMAADSAKAELFSIAIRSDGIIDRRALHTFMGAKADTRPLVCIQAANSETGIVQDVASLAEVARAYDGQVFVDACQAVGREDEAGNTFSFARSTADYAAIASEKFGGPAGVGALVIRAGRELKPFVTGGGQEGRKRSGTENLLGIVGMGAAAKAALGAPGTAGIRAKSTYIRNKVASTAHEAKDIGSGVTRMVNTTCIAVPGWKASTQMMQLDLKGVAISAGSACSSGKVSESRVLRAMGFERMVASSAIRVSIGRTTTDREIEHFLDTWGALLRDRQEKTQKSMNTREDGYRGTRHG